MDERDRRARDIQDRISKILFEDWNPVGLKDDLPSDEYDRYVGGVYRLLVSGASCEQVAEHLAELERDSFGRPEATATRNLAAARRLCELDVRLWISSPGDAGDFHILAGTPFAITRTATNPSRPNPSSKFEVLSSTFRPRFPAAC